MRLLTVRHLAQGLLLAGVLSTTSSCQMLAPLITMPFRLLSSVIGMFSANPIGTAASAAALL